MDQAPKTQPYDSLIGFLRTKREAREALIGLEQVFNDLFRTNVSLHDSLAKNLPIGFSKAIQTYIAQKQFDTNRKETLKPFLEDLMNYIKSLRSISLVIAFSPSEEAITKIFTWVKTNLGGHILIDYTIDRHIVGGAVITYKGLYRDFSLDRLLTESLKEKHDEIISLFS